MKRKIYPEIDVVDNVNGSSWSQIHYATLRKDVLKKNLVFKNAKDAAIASAVLDVLHLSRYSFSNRCVTFFGVGFATAESLIAKNFSDSEIWLTDFDEKTLNDVVVLPVQGNTFHKIVVDLKREIDVELGIGTDTWIFIAVLYALEDSELVQVLRGAREIGVSDILIVHSAEEALGSMIKKVVQSIVRPRFGVKHWGFARTRSHFLNLIYRSGHSVISRIPVEGFETTFVYHLK